MLFTFRKVLFNINWTYQNEQNKATENKRIYKMVKEDTKRLQK